MTMWCGFRVVLSLCGMALCGGMALWCGVVWCGVVLLLCGGVIVWWFDCVAVFTCGVV